MLIHTDARLDADLEIALHGNDFCIFRPECTLINPETGYQLTDAYVRNIYILQDFEASYMDTVQMTLELPIAEYPVLQKNMQNLEAGLVLHPLIHENGADSDLQPPIIFEGMVFLDEQKDIDKQTNPSTVYGNPETGGVESGGQANAYMLLNVHLIQKKMHELRQRKINGIFSGASMEDVLHWTAQQLDITEVTIVPPDNNSAPESVIIPPMKDISNLFPYLQDRYGIYAKGLSYYCVNDHLYIYPSFDTERTTSSDNDSIIHLINGVATDYFGVGHYHATVEHDIYIATVSGTEIAPVNAAASENGGNVIASNNADTAMDRNMTVNPDGSVTKNDNTMTFVGRQNNAGSMAASQQNITYTGNNSNVYNATSNLAKEDGSTLTAKWLNAYPWLLKPGQHVEYHYVDKEQNYQSLPGRLKGIVYMSNTVPTGTRLRPSITFIGALSVFMQAERKDEAAVQYTER